jgi:hypothetical protein
MARIFLTLASLSLILLIATMVIGLTLGDLTPNSPIETLRWATRHRLLGVFAGLSVVFVESIVVTYFIGTSRWCKEVVETYQFDPSIVAMSNRLKRQTFPWALAGMLAVIVIIALGGAADPATMRQNTKAWAYWHLLGAVLGIAFVVWTYLVSWNNIMANHVIIEQIVAKVSSVRRDRGLDIGHDVGR